MSRKVYIGDATNNASVCMDNIKRHSEDKIHFFVITPQYLNNTQLSESNDTDKMFLYVPYLNQFQGMALYVDSSFNYKIDVDMFFNYKVMNNLGSLVYFVKYNAWLFDCNDPALKILTPARINSTQSGNIKNELSITIIDTI